MPRAVLFVGPIVWLLVWLSPSAAAQDPVFSCAFDGSGRARLGGRDVAAVASHTASIEGGGVAFARPEARVDIGPDKALGLASTQSFAVHMRVRTRRAAFCTPLMCREGDAVNYSFVMGRRPGCISFEIWSWQRDRAISTRRLDDGKWHDIVGAFDAATKTMGLLVDGEVQALVPVERGYTPSPRLLLRLGNNIGAHQPFVGGVRGVRVVRAVPEAMRSAVAALAQCTVFGPGEADAMLESWLVRMREPKRPSAASANHWRMKAGRTRARLQAALGLAPPPYPSDDHSFRHSTRFDRYTPDLPLDVRRGGQLKREGYAVTRIYWQTIRGYHASGYLYEPTARFGRLPAVLCPHGHWADGARHPTVQARCITLAKNGYVVLAVDSVHVTDDPIGLSPLSLMTWNNLRGLELLRGLPNVDGKRIGCTGASGGGQQTFYLTGLSTGLAAVVPAVMVCYFEEILLSSGVHCRCNFTPGVMEFADEPLLSACFAPKPQLFLSVTGDWTKNFPKRGYPEVRAVYAHFDALDVVASQQWDTHHDYNREMRNAMYAFFGRHLKGEEAPAAELEAPGLRTEPRNTLVALDRRGVPRDLEAVRREFRARLAARTVSREALRDRFGGALRTVKREPRDELFGWHGFAGQRFELHVREGIRLPLVVLRPEKVRSVTVFVSDRGKASVILRHEKLLQRLLRSGVAVWLVDVRYTGELDRAPTWREPYGRIFGRDVGVVAADDIAHVLQAAAEAHGLTPGHTTLVAEGELGAPALYAVAVHGRCGSLVTPELGATYTTVDRRPKIAGILRVGDLPAVAGLLPKALLFVAGRCGEPGRFPKRRGFSIERAPVDLAAVLLK